MARITLAENSEYYGFPLGNISIQTFSDGEIKVEMKESVRGAYTFLIPNSPASNIIELLLMIDCAKRHLPDILRPSSRILAMCVKTEKINPEYPLFQQKLMANLFQASGVDR